MKYVSPEYELQLETLADTLMAARRQKLGQLSLFELEQQAVESVVSREIPANVELGVE